MASNKLGGNGFSSVQPTRLTPAEVQELGNFFKQLLESSKLSKWIVLAGIGALVETAHILWQAARFLLGR
jgi:hypothetical protein